MTQFKDAPQLLVRVFIKWIQVETKGSREQNGVLTKNKQTNKGIQVKTKGSREQHGVLTRNKQQQQQQQQQQRDPS